MFHGTDSLTFALSNILQMKTTGNTILITGGSSGIGLALAQRLLSLNNKVIITGRDLQKLEMVQKQTPGLDIFACDLTEPNALDILVQDIKKRHGDLNVLVNNAAIQYNYSFAEESNVVGKIDHEIATNISAPMKLTALLLPLLLKNKGSAVVNVSSGLAIAPKTSASVYCASKAAIHSYSKTLRYQLESRGVKVFEIIPPLVATPMTEGRGKSKITPERLVDEFIKNFEADQYESYIGKAKILNVLSRIWPSMADRIMKNGL